MSEPEPKPCHYWTKLVVPLDQLLPAGALGDAPGWLNRLMAGAILSPVLRDAAVITGSDPLPGDPPVVLAVLTGVVFMPALDAPGPITGAFDEWAAIVARLGGTLRASDLVDASAVELEEAG